MYVQYIHPMSGRGGFTLTISPVKVVPGGREGERDIGAEGTTAKIVDACWRVTQPHRT